MSYTDLRDFESELTATLDDGLTVSIEKLGGGTLGHSYTGTWRYIVTDSDGDEVGRGQDLETGMPKTHAEVVNIVAGYFREEF